MHRLGFDSSVSAKIFGNPPPMASKTKMDDKPKASFVGCSSKLRSWSFLMKVPYKGVGLILEEIAPS